MSKIKKIFLVILVNLIIIISQIIFGYISNSFALIADALHNAGDVLSIIVTYIALILGTKTATFKKTFGYIRAEMMAAFVNTLFLYTTMIYMIYESINRFFNPEVIEPIYMIIVGLIAVIANGISAYVLKKLEVSSCSSHDHGHVHSHDDGDANIKSAYLHMLSDTLISMSVVIAGIFIYYFKIYSIDSILTILFSIFILFHSYGLLKKSFLSLMDMNITNISQEKLDAIIKQSSTVIDYDDLHIYKPSSKYNFISFCLILNNQITPLKEVTQLINHIKKQLETIGFNHITIEVDYHDNLKNRKKCTL
ncbi:MAG: cation diffusion facilitator family transporter [Candidatus Altimarinota bacterium]|jgi:cobalt-zinc-cadmium efflux system protein